MADAAVEFLLENLKQLLLDHVQLIGDARKEVERLVKDLRILRSFLKDTIKLRRKNETTQQLIREIRDVVYEAEDIIDAFVTQEIDTKSMNFMKRAFRKPINLLDVANNVQDVSAKILDIRRDSVWMSSLSLSLRAEAPKQFEAPIIKEENVVELKDQVDMIIGYLKKETKKLDPICITGLPGLGKTTITRKIFRDARLRFLFLRHIWVNVSQEFNRRNVFVTMLKQLPRSTDDIHEKSDEDLAKLVSSQLMEGNFLIVLDDIWTTDNWENLQAAFPKEVKMGKILITSRIDEVGDCVNPDRDPHKLRLLKEEEGWLLLQYEVFGKPNQFPPELENPGKAIVARCGMLPLAIVVIGGILKTKEYKKGDIAEREKAWTKVSKNVNEQLNLTTRMEEIIDLSYNKLPYHLRACFLYFGIFPEDFEIPAWKLTRMWIGEGFIQPRRRNGMSFQDIAESYLEDLINWNLVSVDKRGRDGKPKICRIHDMLHNFCREAATEERENFLEEVKMTTERPLFPANIQKSRRLCIHPQLLQNFFSSRPSGPCVRAFLCSSPKDVVVDLPNENISAIPTAFPLVRVLEVEPIKFSRLPRDLCHLVHLRYIVLSFTLEVIPPFFSKLWNLQTLIVKTTSSTLSTDIWKMVHLTHFKTNASAILPNPGGRSSAQGDSSRIQTLGTISPNSCNDAVFSQVPNVKKLGIRGQLALILGSTNGSFDSLGRLSSLEKLKLMNDMRSSPPSGGELRVLPSHNRFPRNLKWLTLSKTYLQWSEMSNLGLLINLEVLKLKDGAFDGDTWEMVEGGFRNLEYLYIERMNLACWMADGSNFPKLKSIELKNCEKLQKIPLGLADIRAFRILDLECTPRAEASAIEICDKKKENEDERTTESNRFKLYIFPPRAV